MMFDEDYQIEAEYEQYIASQYQEYLENLAEDWAYDNVILPEYFASISDYEKTI